MQQALTDAQREADRILRSYQVNRQARWRRSLLYGWLQLLSAIVLLAAHALPGGADVLAQFSFLLQRARPARFVGLKPRRHARRSGVLAVAADGGFALSTTPTSIGIAPIMALWVNRNLSGRGFLRMAHFTPIAADGGGYHTPQYGLIAQVMACSATAGADAGDGVEIVFRTFYPSPCRP